jgi:hypothetical protein
MDKILFSLPVHERPDIVRDQIENLLYFTPGSLVCVHVSASAAESVDEYKRHCDLPGVFINPRRYETTAGKGILHTHISNFEHMAWQGEAFDKVMLISSNEMLIRKGLAEHVSRFRLGAQTEVFDRSVDWHLFRAEMLDDVRVRGMLDQLGLPIFFGGQAEGQFFNREIFDQVYKIYTSHFPMASCGFVTEEMIPPTVAAFSTMNGIDAALPITVCDYCTLLKMDIGVVDRIREGVGSLVSVKIPRTLRSPHHNVSTLASIFSIKRVPREDCELRRYVRSLETEDAARPVLVA